MIRGDRAATLQRCLTQLYRTIGFDPELRAEIFMSSATANRRGTIEKVLIGCGAAIVVGLLICAGVAFWAAPRVIKQVQLAVKEAGDFLEREAAREAFLQEWTPPDPTTTADQRFPPQIGAFTRTAEPDEAVLRKFGLVDELPHATYASPEQIVEVYLKPMSDQERRAAYVSLQTRSRRNAMGRAASGPPRGVRTPTASIFIHLRRRGAGGAGGAKVGWRSH